MAPVAGTPGVGLLTATTVFTPVTSGPFIANAPVIDDPRCMIAAAYARGGARHAAPAMAIPAVDTVATLRPVIAQHPAVSHGPRRAGRQLPASAAAVAIQYLIPTVPTQRLAELPLQPVDAGPATAAI